MKTKERLVNDQGLVLFGQLSCGKVPAKRSQHANATCRNIVGRNIWRAFGHLVATCWVLLAQI